MQPVLYLVRMMRPLIVEYLKSHTFGELEEEWGVDVSVSRSRPYKLSANYSQIVSKPSPFVNQCRGLILQTTNGLELPIDSKELAKICPGPTTVLARPFDRFFNHGDPNAANIDWDDPGLTVVEKLDGTLAIVYYDDSSGEWCMATRSVPDADLPFDGGSMTFRKLFDRALVETTGSESLGFFMDTTDRDLTFCFELTTPLNRIVVEYNTYDLTWIGTRHRKTGKELTYRDTMKRVAPHTARHMPPAAKTWAVGSLEEITVALEASSPTELEGVVVVDSEFQRLKIKSLAWLSANKAKSSCSSPRAILTLILQEKIDDVLPLLPPDICLTVDRMKTSLTELYHTTDRRYSEFLAASEGNRKAFALSVQADPSVWPAAMFGLYVKPQSMREWVASRGGEGGWPDSFLDNILRAIGEKQ